MPTLLALEDGDTKFSLCSKIPLQTLWPLGGPGPLFCSGLLPIGSQPFGYGIRDLLGNSQYNALEARWLLAS